MKTRHRLTALFLCCALCAVLTACERDERSSRAIERLTAVQEFFSALEKHNYPQAQTALAKLRTFDPDNDYLPSVANTLRNNAVLAQLQPYLDRGQIRAGLVFIEKEIRENGPSDVLSRTAMELRELENVQLLIEESAEATDVALLDNDLRRIERLHNNHKELHVITEPLLAQRRLLRAELQRTDELAICADMMLDYSRSPNVIDAHFGKNFSKQTDVSPRFSERFAAPDDSNSYHFPILHNRTQP